MYGRECVTTLSLKPETRLVALLRACVFGVIEDSVFLCLGSCRGWTTSASLLSTRTSQRRSTGCRPFAHSGTCAVSMHFTLAPSLHGTPLNLKARGFLAALSRCNFLFALSWLSTLSQGASSMCTAMRLTLVPSWHGLSLALSQGTSFHVEVTGHPVNVSFPL